MTAPVRLVRVTGLLTWVLVATPPAVEGLGDAGEFRAWLSAMMLFAALFWWSTGRLAAPSAATWAALAGQSACAIVASAAQHHGLEGTLLVLVSLQLGFVATPRLGLAWIAVQSLGMAWGIQHHWALRPALMFAPPYVGFQALTFAMVRLLAREARGRESLARANAELLATRAHLAEAARVDERLRIAHELHDAMGHHLAGLSLNLEVLGQRHGASAPLDTARSLTGRLLDDLESLVDALGRERPLDLQGALASLSRDIPRPRVHVSAPERPFADPERSHALWRCCQEIVTNAVKHSDAENLWIAIRVADGRIELTARDDCAGSPAPGVGLGLEGMRQRVSDLGGTLRLETGCGAGFEVHLSVPAGIG